MCSTPAATTQSYVPDAMSAVAKLTACCDDPHWRSIVVAAVLTGRPA